MICVNFECEVGPLINENIFPQIALVFLIANVSWIPKIWEQSLIRQPHFLFLFFSTGQQAYTQL